MNLEEFRKGQALFNDRHFFECHEFFEGVWNREKGGAKLLAQGLTQVAAAMYKLQKERHAYEGALYLMDHGLQKIEANLGLVGATAAALAPLIEIRNRVVAEDIDVDHLPRLHLV